MKIWILGFILATGAVPLKAHADMETQALQRQQKHCNCFELERRIAGLHTVLQRARLGYYQERQIRRDLSQAQAYYRRVNFRRDSLSDQNRVCSLGNQAADSSWRQWQPWLARSRMDRGLPRGCNLAL